LDYVVTLCLGSVDFVNDTSKELTKENSPVCSATSFELTKENSPPVVDRELTAPPFIVATVVMEKEFVF
jgi:hypothetical protein